MSDGAAFAGVLALDAGATLLRVVAGVSMSAPIGAALGVALGGTAARWKRAAPVVESVRAVPPILTYPMFLLGMGYGEGARLCAIVFGTAGVVLVPVAAAVLGAPRARREAADLLGLRGLRRVVELTAFEALPGLFVGLRLALTGALVIAVVTEMLVGADHGLGARAQAALVAYRDGELWAVAVVAAALNLALSRVVGLIERKVVTWE